MERTPDAARGRLYYGKSYIYPLFAAPFVWLIGTTGFLVFHALLLTLDVALAYRYLAARGSSPGLAAGFAVGVSLRLGDAGLLRVAHAGALQLHARSHARSFSGATKRIAPPAGAGTRGSNGSCARRARTTRRSALLGIATFSKPTHILLTLPIGATALFAREWRRLALMIVCFSLVVVGPLRR